MASSFQEHFGTNYAPSVDEVRQIKDLLDSSSKEIHDVDVEIDRVQRQLEHLQAKRLKISDLAEQHRALLSPVRRLSRDALEAIFLACLPTYRNPCMSATEAPILLTQVSSSWRNIAHSTPRLWAAIHIVLPSVKAQGHPHPARYFSEREALVRLRLTQREAGTKEWLERAGVCPLSISIFQSLKNESYGSITQKFRELHLSFLSSIIAPYHKRWHDIDMHVTADTLNGLLTSGPHGLTGECMPMLKNVHINVNQSIGHWTPLAKWTNIVGLLSSQVATATLSGIYVNSVDLSSTPEHVWGQLTELNLELHPLDSTKVNLRDVSFAIIRHCLALKILKLNVVPASFESRNQQNHNDNDRNTWPQTMVNIPLHHLTTLSLSLPPTADSVDFVKRLHLPSIRQLDFEFTRPHGSGQFFTLAEDVLKMALRASEDGVSLGLHDSFWLTSSTEMLQILQHIPIITSLKLTTAKIKNDQWPSSLSHLSQFQRVLNDDLLSALSPAGKKYSEIICPQLEVLDCDYKYQTEISEQGLKAFVQARREAHLSDRSIAALRKLCISINDYKQDVQADEEVSLGEDSAIYFWKRVHESLSPWEGLKVQKEKRVIKSAYPALERTIYTTL
ncbi:hypothetical protein BDQ17DRAFT_1270522 [Cyathus striatus]|nr:hypothetical protein BDQ17DRAFT_1270522 [Cyathus striatus]